MRVSATTLAKTKPTIQGRSAIQGLRSQTHRHLPRFRIIEHALKYGRADAATLIVGINHEFAYKDVVSAVLDTAIAAANCVAQNDFMRGLYPRIGKELILGCFLHGPILALDDFTIGPVMDDAREFVIGFRGLTF